MCITLNIQVDTHNFVHISVSEFSCTCNAKTQIFSLQIHMYIIIYIVVQKYK